MKPLAIGLILYVVIVGWALIRNYRPAQPLTKVVAAKRGGDIGSKSMELIAEDDTVLQVGPREWVRTKIGERATGFWK